MKILTIFLLLLSGCSAPDVVSDDCKFMMGKYDIIPTALADLPSIALDKVSAKSLATIKKCYPKNKFLGENILLYTVKISKSGNIYVIYTPENVTDVKVVFEIDKNGMVTKIYQAPANLT